MSRTEMSVCLKNYYHIRYARIHEIFTMSFRNWYCTRGFHTLFIDLQSTMLVQILQRAMKTSAEKPSVLFYEKLKIQNIILISTNTFLGCEIYWIPQIIIFTIVNEVFPIVESNHKKNTESRLYMTIFRMQIMISRLSLINTVFRQ